MTVRGMELFSSRHAGKCFNAGEFSHAGSSEDEEVRVMSASKLLRASREVPGLSCSVLVRLALRLAGSVRRYRGLCQLVYFGICTRGESSRSGGFACLCSRSRNY